MRYWAFLAASGVFACSDRVEPTAPTEPVADATADAAPSIELNVVDYRRRLANSALSGGVTTVFDISEDAFSHAAPNLKGLRLAKHEAGDAGFEAEFETTAGAINSGLGPVFDNISCEACHDGDGRGRPPVGAEPFESMLFRSSIAGIGPHGGPLPVPGGIGGQLQLQAVPGFLPDAYAYIAYHDSTSRFADGTTYTLRVPQYSLIGARTPLPAGVLFSPRTAPAVFGLGLLEAVPDIEILSLAAAQAVAREVSGRPNYVWDAVRRQYALGRFGWKANTPNLVQQAAGAYNGDMGITSSLFPSESCEGAAPECALHAAEVPDQTVANVAFYTRTLGVPARRGLNDPAALRGEQVFYNVGCANCHVPTLRTGVLAGVPEVSGQVIHPYTDLLVHDMGRELADNRPDFQASGHEWRTAPLWGVGLIQTVSGHSNLLHDGRARSLLEAVLWHSGEATTARDRVRRLSGTDRAALVVFLSSL